MATVKTAKQRSRWSAFTTSFKQSNYITDFWNWLMTLLSKSAELVLFGSILYSSYQLIPGVPHVPASMDAVFFVVQQAALDVGGMGLLKLAKKAGLPQNSFPMRVGVTLVVLMILNVVLASIKHELPMVPDQVYVAIETILLVARAVMAVLFGHAIHALREEYGESTIVIKEAQELQEKLEKLSTEVAFMQQGFQGEMTSFHEQLSSALSQMREGFHAELSRVQENVHQQLSQMRESFHAELTSVQENVHEQLSTELSQFEETFDTYQSMLAVFPQLEMQMQSIPQLRAQLQQVESVTVEELRRVKITLEKQALSPLVEAQRPQLRALPAGRTSAAATAPDVKPTRKETRQPAQQGSSGEKFDARSFVFACLEMNPDLKLSEIEQLAAARGQELSQPTASRYRKQFFADRESAESSTLKAGPIVESSVMKAESESFHRTESSRESFQDERESSDERRIVGE